MLQVLSKEKLAAVKYIIGSEDVLLNMPNVHPRMRFDDAVIEFLDILSKKILGRKASRQYPDVITLGFWMRKGNILALKKEFPNREGCLTIGRGMAFHVSPSNVPVNCMYSLVSGLLAGNANVVKIPSKDFEQIDLIVDALKEALDEMVEMKPYIVLIRYGHEQEINEALSEFTDARVIWGGDQTIAQVRKAPIPARAVEVDFADRYSLAVVDSDAYLQTEDKALVANGFFNDTYLSDQNACTSPRIIVWTGTKIAEAKKLFWHELHELLRDRYALQPVQAVNKLTSGYLAAALWGDVVREPMPDNLITRIRVNTVSDSLMDLKDNSGYFFEYDCNDVTEIAELCNNTHCQTLAYLGNPERFQNLFEKGIKGIDRIVPIGKTMDFDFIWDGYNLMEMLSRVVRIR